MLLLHQINQWYCKGTRECQSVNCQSLMFYWFYRNVFKIGSCFSCKRSNDFHHVILLKLCLNIPFFSPDYSSSQFWYIFVHHTFSWHSFLFLPLTFTPSSYSLSLCAGNTFPVSLSTSIWSSNFCFLLYVKKLLNTRLSMFSATAVNQ